VIHRRFALIGLTAALALGASAALAQKSQSQLDWEASQAAYLAENLKKPGWKATPSGVQYKRSSRANPKGAQPTPASEVEVKYVGTTISDNEFDSTAEGETSSFKLEDVIPGWQQAIPLMREGEVWDFAIPAELGYGDRAKPRIPTGSALLFKVTLVKVLSNPALPVAAKPAAKK
jgi:FKBP-type peptidyl-prolyl cis-trans isomerase FkpA